MPNNFTIVIVVNDEQPVNNMVISEGHIKIHCRGRSFLSDNYLSEVVTVIIVSLSFCMFVETRIYIDNILIFSLAVSL